MQTYWIEGDRYATALQLHEALQRMLSLPEYYGKNADALNDCLGERGPICFVIVSMGEGEVATALERCCRVVRDHGGIVR